MTERRWVIALATCFLTCCSAHPPASNERQLTSIVGMASSPVLSRDGATLAFAAAPDNHSNPQIWVARLDGAAPPVQLTSDGAQNYDPDFTSDSRTIYYTSSRTPRGLYRVPVSGGVSKLVVEGGWVAKVSPDGRTLLYGKGSGLYRRDIDGGTSTPVLPAASNSYSPVWSPDGSRIMVTAQNPSEPGAEWWIVPLQGGTPRRTGIVAELRNEGFNNEILNAWTPGDWIVFSGMQGETMTLWKVQLGADGKMQGRPVRATSDPQGDYGASYAAGKLVYARTRVDMNFWALPLDPNGERIAGRPQPLTSTLARKGQQSAAGRKLLYSAENGDRFSLFLKDFRNRREKLLRDCFFAVLSPDGSRYVYGEGTSEQLTLLMTSTGWWPFWSSTLCQNCGMPRGFSPDGRRLLLWTNTPGAQHLDMLNLANGQLNRIVSSDKDLVGPSLAPDGQWVIFVAKVGEHEWQTFIAPASAEKQLSSLEWIPVTAVSDSFHFAFWSERGDIVYTLTARGGSGNLKWLEAQRVDQSSKHPIGAPWQLHEFEELRAPGMDPVWNAVSVNDGKIILELGDSSTNIWVKDLK